LQQQEKHLSSTRVLLDPDGAIAGFYTLATGQVDCSDLPADVLRQLPLGQASCRLSDRLAKDLV
jgi:hypothetical protein